MLDKIKKVYVKADNAWNNSSLTKKTTILVVAALAITAVFIVKDKMNEASIIADIDMVEGDSLL